MYECIFEIDERVNSVSMLDTYEQVKCWFMSSYGRVAGQLPGEVIDIFMDRLDVAVEHDGHEYYWHVEKSK